MIAHYLQAYHIALGITKNNGEITKNNGELLCSG